MRVPSTKKGRQAARTVTGVVDDAAERIGLRTAVDQSPLAIAGAALAVGYVLGGGLFTRSTVRLVEFGAALSQVPFIRVPVLRAIETALDSALNRAKTIAQA